MNVEKFTNLLSTFSRTAAFLALLVPLSLAPRGAAQTSKNPRNQSSHR